MPLGLGSPRRGFAHARRQRPSGRHVELLVDEVHVGDKLAHPVLDLEPGIDLEEPEIAIRSQQELGRRGIGQADRGGDLDAELVQPPPLVGRQTRRRRLFHELLVAALDGAVALAQGNNRAVLVADQLHLDVPGALDIALEIDGAIAEGGGGFARCGNDSILKVGRLVHPAHAPATAACRGLDEHRIADVLRFGRDRTPSVGSGRGDRLEGARDDGHVGGRGPGTRLELVAQLSQGLRRRTDERDPSRRAGLGQLRLLGQEAVARVQRIGAAGASRVHDVPDVQV
jgi:hypothetical protein